MVIDIPALDIWLYLVREKVNPHPFTIIIIGSRHRANLNATRISQGQKRVS